VSKTFGKGPNTLGKAFAECHTRQRAHDKILVGKGVFAECFLSGTRQRLCRVPTLGKEKNKKNCRVSKTFGKGPNTLGKAFAECGTRQRAHGKILVGKGVFAKCFLSGTRQRLCRVPTLGKEKNKKKLKNRKKIVFFGEGLPSA